MVHRPDVLAVRTNHFHVLLDIGLMDHRHLHCDCSQSQPMVRADVPGTCLISRGSFLRWRMSFSENRCPLFRDIGEP
jgi:hypothetical protein